ncbi:MAG TPA: flavodoxin [Atopostipes sp.]|nr:flavodoxin [Atopostipes sp.]
MTQALIVYASLTGNTRAGAEIVEDTFEEMNVNVDVLESYDADPFDFEDYDICVVGTYTYGIHGELPDEIVDFYEELEDVELTEKLYGVFGSGDVFYGDKYCKSVDDFVEQFEKTGALQGSEVVKYNLDPDEEATQALKEFAKELVAKHEQMN